MKRVFSLVTASIVVTTALVAVKTPAHASYWTIFTGYPVVVSNPATNRVIDVAGNSTSDTAAIRTSTFVGWSPQNWQFVASGGYLYAVVQHSGKCLDVQWGSHDAGAPIWQWPCNRGDAQLWSVEMLGNDRFGAPMARLRNKGSGQCLTMVDVAAPQGSQLRQNPCDGGPAQQWQFTHPIVNLSSHTVFTAAPVQVLGSVTTRPFAGSPSQDLQLQYAGVVDADGSDGFRFVGGGVNGCLEPSTLFGGTPAAGTTVTMAGCNNDRKEIWYVRQQFRDQFSASVWRIYHADTRLCLDINGGAPAAQSYLQLYPCHGGWNQQWHF